MVSALLSPRMLLLHVFAVAAIGGTGWLGAWQVGAWQEHREDRTASVRDAAALPLDEVLGPDDPFPGEHVGQPVSVQGEWLSGDTVHVEHDTGTWVVTPVETGSGSAVLVVRGSIDEQTAPSPAGDAVLEGWLQPSSDTGVSVTDVLQEMDQDLYGGYVITRDPVEPALTPVTPDQLPKPPAFTSIRNLLYGLEWWVFGGFAVFLWWRWCRDEVERVRSGTRSEVLEDPEVPSGA